MISTVPPVPVPPPERAKETTVYVQKEWADIQVFKSREAAVAYRDEMGGFISFDGVKFHVIFVPNE